MADGLHHASGEPADPHRVLIPRRDLDELRQALWGADLAGLLPVGSDRWDRELDLHKAERLVESTVELVNAARRLLEVADAR